MRELMLFRHAKSRWDEAGVTDHDRDLAPRGLEAAPKMGRLLSAKTLVPDAVVVSTAKRALRTWELASTALRPPPVVRVEAAVYEAGVERLLAIVGATDPSIRRLLLVGHNPGMQQLTKSLAGEEAALAAFGGIDKFPTAAIAMLELAIDDWLETRPGCGRLADFFKPRDLD